MSALPRPTEIRLRSNTRLGRGGELIAAWLEQEDDGAVGLVVDEAVADQTAVAGLVAALRATGRPLAPVLRSRSGEEPDYDYLDEAAAAFRAQAPAAIVAVGGGSTLDLAKGIAILVHNPGRGIDYRGFDRVRAPGPPVACAPTTAGSGSEATATASFVDNESRTKLGINGRHVGAALAVLDPELLLESPRSVTVGSGLDALVHAVEAATARTAGSLSILLGCEAVRLLFDALPRAVERPDDLDARADALLGAHVAALAMQNAAGGPASGVSYPVGVHHGVPHGYAGGVLLPHVVAANAAAGWRGYERLAAGAGTGDFGRALFELYDRIAAPTTFAAWGVGAKDVERLTALVLEQRRENLELNPVPFGRDELRSLLERVTSERGG